VFRGPAGNRHEERGRKAHASLRPRNTSKDRHRALSSHCQTASKILSVAVDQLHRPSHFDVAHRTRGRPKPAMGKSDCRMTKTRRIGMPLTALRASERPGGARHSAGQKSASVVISAAASLNREIVIPPVRRLIRACSPVLSGRGVARPGCAPAFMAGARRHASRSALRDGSEPQ
jgi:hypothetical protein